MSTRCSGDNKEKLSTNIHSEYVSDFCLDRKSTLNVNSIPLKGGFPVMAEITHILTVNIPGQFFFVITTRPSTRCLVQNVQLICYSQRVNATSQYNDSGSSKTSKMAKGSDGYSGETVLAPCTRKRRMQRNQSSDILQHSQNRPTGDRWIKIKIRQSRL